MIWRYPKPESHFWNKNFTMKQRKGQVQKNDFSEQSVKAGSVIPWGWTCSWVLPLDGDLGTWRLYQSVMSSFARYPSGRHWTLCNHLQVITAFPWGNLCHLLGSSVSLGRTSLGMSGLPVHWALIRPPRITWTIGFCDIGIRITNMEINPKLKKKMMVKRRPR